MKCLFSFIHFFLTPSQDIGDSPIISTPLNRELSKKLFRKARNVELSCYEDHEFYNKYTLAMEKADERLIETVDVI